jgi:protein gp37
LGGLIVAETTGIGWTDATVNFVIGCTKVGPGCDHCYAAEFALKKWGIEFEPGGRRHVTASGFQDPPTWQRKHDAGILSRVYQNRIIKTPVWVFACSLSDFFDNEWKLETRERAWAVIRKCHSLRWQIVTKRVGNVAKMLPADWDGGRNYPNVGIIATVVNQEEYDRDAPKLHRLRQLGVKWIGLSIEPQLGEIQLDPRYPVDWVICGGESKQVRFDARPFHVEWARSLKDQCARLGIPFFMKQFGDNPHEYGGYTKRFGKSAGTDMSRWPEDLRIQQMPHIYDADPVAIKPDEPKDLFEAAR